ncbi:MAG: hypothetical protein ACI9UH_000343 [Gammaproteobacteria bacterium]|jgi:hypothetical protein
MLAPQFDTPVTLEPSISALRLALAMAITSLAPQACEAHIYFFRNGFNIKSKNFLVKHQVTSDNR